MALNCFEGPFALNDHQPYMEIMAHELLQLYWYGVDVTLPESMTTNPGETINVKAMLLHWIGDYRGLPKTFRTSQSPSLLFSCYQCAIHGFKVMGKTIFPGAWKYCNPSDTARRVNGSKLNNPNRDNNPNNPEPDEKDDDYYRRAAKSADKSTREGVKFDSDHHPRKKSGIIIICMTLCVR